MVLLRVDNRVRFPREELTVEVQQELQREFTYKNPDADKWKRLGLYGKGPPKWVSTWRAERGDLTFPRGGLARVQQVLTRARIEHELRDERILGRAPSARLHHKVELRPFQRDLVLAGLDAETALWRAPAGCVSGDAEVVINRGGKGARMKLSHVVRMLHGGVAANRRWDQTIPTYVRAPMADGTVRLARVLAAKDSGVRGVWRLSAGGFHLTATPDHRVLTPFGWVALAELGPGDFVMVDDLRPQKRGQKKKAHRKNVEVRLRPVAVTSVEKGHVEPTFDLTVEGASAFVANRIAVHNSGKTTAALAWAAEVQVPVLVVVWTTNLLDQWVRRCRAELDYDPGVIQGAKRTVRHITVGMQQTLCRCIDDYALQFGAVVCDEVQRFAASTFGAVVDALPARYRLGVSADERRSDRKQFLIYDHFGGVAEEVSHDELVADGIIHEVAVRVVPTAFRADWWHEVPPSARTEFYDRLLGELSNDVERNLLIGRVAQWSLDEQEQVLVLTQRREHAHILDTALVALGVKSGLLIGGDDYREQYERARRGLEAGTVRAAVGTYQAVGTGIDLPRVARGVLALPVANSDAARPQWLQYRGRFARTAEGKTDAVVYYLWDREVFGVRPLRNLCRWNHVVTVLEPDGRWRSGHEVAKEMDDENEKRKTDREADDLGGIFLRR